MKISLSKIYFKVIIIPVKKIKKNHEPYRQKSIKNDIFIWSFSIITSLLIFLVYPFEIKVEIDILYYIFSTMVVFFFSAFLSKNVGGNYFNFRTVYPEIYGILFGPLWEEMNFRYLLMNIVKSESMMIISTLIFSLLHPIIDNENVEDVAYRTIITSISSTFFLLVYILSRNILYSIIVHSFWNLLNFFMMRIRGKTFYSYFR